VVATLGESVILSQEIQLIEILVMFSCDFSSYRITCARVATHAIFVARWGRDNFKKIASPWQGKKSLV